MTRCLRTAGTPTQYGVHGVSFTELARGGSLLITDNDLVWHYASIAV